MSPLAPTGRHKLSSRTGRRKLLGAVLLTALLLFSLITFTGLGGKAVCLGGAALCDSRAITAPGEGAGGASRPADPDPTASPAAPTASPSGSGSPGPVPSSSLSRSPGPRDAKPPARRGCASPRACGYPDASTTGPRMATLTPQSTGNASIRTDGTVIRGWDITGSLDIYANDVTVIDSRITSTNWWGINLRPGFKGLRILHTEINAVPGKGPNNGGSDYAVSNMSTSSVEVGHCDISGFGDALSMGQGNLHDNYVHGIVPYKNLDGVWQHTNAVISNGGGQGKLIIRHNTLINATPVDQGASAAVGLFADAAPVTHTVVDDNWLAGGAYALYAGGKDSSGIEVTDNVFSPEIYPSGGRYGAVAYWNAAGQGNIWRGNRMADGTPVVPAPE
ncbi:hypothetical protein [Streptomyces showdoensis]|uniref:hypothetical protein n=1 Tax=Streptomyces showdoensis TaxID=68268 RepID=UPI000F50AFC4|nr:hypothetical protein [Streptomyces showdoensis]